MSTNLSVSRKQILQISLAAALIFVVLNLATTAMVATQLFLPSDELSQDSNLQQQNLQKAITIIQEQTLQN